MIGHKGNSPTRVLHAASIALLLLLPPFLNFAHAEANTKAAMLLNSARLDRLITDPDLEVVAPEYSPTGREMSHCTRDGRVHIMPLSFAGVLADPTGASDTFLGACNFLVNGPEWGFTATALVLAWTTPPTSGGNNQLAVAMRPMDSTVWKELNPLPGSTGLATPYPIKSSESRRPWLLYSVGGSKKASMIYNLSGGTALPTNNPYPTWKPETYEVVDVDPRSGEIVSLNVISGESRVASNVSPDRRFNPWLWIAPESGEEAALVFNLTSGCVEFYYQTGGMAQPDKEVCGADFGDGAKIVTPEPFILRERSYVSFLVEMPVDFGPALKGVYVAGAYDLPGEEPHLERTSSDESRFRRDPEPVVNWRRAYIYYSAPSGPGTGYGVWQTVVQGRPNFEPLPE